MSRWTDLLEFVRGHAAEYSLTVYVEAPPADPAERTAWHVVVCREFGRIRQELEAALPEERLAFERCAEAFLDAVPTSRRLPQGASLAWFGASAGAVLALPLPVGVETRVYWATGPRVFPYLRAADGSGALVVQIDRQHLRITRWSDDRFEPLHRADVEPLGEVGSFTSAVPEPGFHQGTRGRSGKDEAERYRETEVARLINDAVARVKALATRGMVVLIGGGTAVAEALLAKLPETVADTSGLVRDLRMGPPEDAEQELREALHTVQARRQKQRAFELREAAAYSGRIATDFAIANRAAELGGVAELIIGDSAWQRRPAEIETLVQRAMLSGADVQWAEPSALDGTDGTGGADGANGLIAVLRIPTISLLELPQDDNGHD